MKHKFVFLLLFCCLFATKFYGQQAVSSSPIDISYQKSAANDTIWVFAKTSQETKPGTLMLVTTANNALKSDTAFFPIIDTISAFILAIPQEYRTGALQLQAFFYPKIFHVKGKILSKVKNKTINAVLITDNQRIYNKALSLSGDNEFSLPGLVFNTKASLIFNYATDDKKNHPDVSINRSLLLKILRIKCLLKASY
jgi:hypothetical protein